MATHITPRTERQLIAEQTKDTRCSIVVEVFWRIRVMLQCCFEIQMQIAEVEVAMSAPEAKEVVQ